MRNRIDELESAVTRLEASVDGMRTQLVEAKDRIRRLEREIAESREDPAASDQPRQGSAPGAESHEGDRAESNRALEDIIVA